MKNPIKLFRDGMFYEVQQAANSYDDSANMNFDDQAQSFAGKNPNQPERILQKANFDLTMVNASAEVLTFELFNRLRTFIENRNTALVTSATVTYIPQTSFEGLAAAGVGVVGFTQNGLLRATGAAAATALTVDCPQYTYRGLLLSSGQRPFRIVGIRMTVQNDAQIDNELIHFTANFLGATNRNTISPRTFFNPQQFQTKIVDISCDLPIDDQKGLIYKLNAGETVKFNVLIER
jgi:hypothetical protein